MRECYSIKVYDKMADELVDAFICCGIIKKNLDDYEHKWLPMFEKARPKLKKAGVCIEDANWDWNIKATVTEGLLAYDQFVIEVNGETQGMMIIETAKKTSKLQTGKPIVYIEYLASAPWNRKAILETPKYGLVGKMLFSQAIGESVEKGFNGRVGLHSLPGAYRWYEHQGLTKFKLEQDNSLHYFELDEMTALKLLSKIKGGSDV